LTNSAWRILADFHIRSGGFEKNYLATLNYSRIVNQQTFRFPQMRSGHSQKSGEEIAAAPPTASGASAAAAIAIAKVGSLSLSDSESDGVAREKERSAIPAKRATSRLARSRSKVPKKKAKKARRRRKESSSLSSSSERDGSRRRGVGKGPLRQEG
jgi:hypothetical protein